MQNNPVEKLRLIMFYVYVLQNKNYNIYIGYTRDLKRRFQEHNQGLNQSTRARKPWELIYYEACLNDKDAKRREKYLKTTQGRRLLQRRIKEFFYNKGIKSKFFYWV